MAEDMKHLLVHCPCLCKQRAQLLQRLRNLDNRLLTLQKLLGPWPTNVLQKRALLAVRDVFNDNYNVNNY